MKNKDYFLLLYFFILIKSNEMINNIFPFYPYDKILEQNFEDYCLKINLKKDCIIEHLSNLSIDKIKNISYDFIKSNYENDKNEEGLDKNDLKDIIGSSSSDFFELFGPIIVDGLYSLKEYGKKIINDKNDKIILEIEKILKDEKYQTLVNEYLKEDLIKLIEEGISQFDKNLFIRDFLKKQNLNDLNYKLNSNINSLNFIILGENIVEKNKFINNILEINSTIDDNSPKVNETDKLNNFIKYRNNNKIGIELIKSNIKDFKKELNDFDLYFNNKIIPMGNNFIYGFIYLPDNEEEKEDLSQLYKYHYSKIPIKEIKVNIDKNKAKNNFINFILKELNENKLKDIYKYYYSLNVFQILINKIILLNQLVNIFSTIPKREKKIENHEDATNLILNKLQLNLNTLLLRPYLDYQEIKKSIRNVYSKLFKQINQDLKSKNIDYNLEETKSILDVFNYLEDYHPNDVIPIFFYEKIKKLFEKIFINKFKEMFVNYPFDIEKYPDFLNIINNIEKNFSHSNKIKYLFIIILIVVAILICFGIYYFIGKRKNEKNIVQDKELELIE